jgi:Protein of unknown function (DUF3105)
MRKGMGCVVAALIVAMLAISACGESSDGSGNSAHVNEESGSSHDLLPDERKGPTPVPVKNKKLAKAAEEANCFLLRGIKAKYEGQLSPDAKAPNYRTEPPVSGPYVEPPYQQADGAYLNLPDRTDQVGALNNGRMTIQYAPDLAEKNQLELKGLYDTMYGATLLFPNDEMDFAVAATTWGNILGCTVYDTQNTLDALRAFGKATWGKYGDQPVESFPFEGPTPAKPEEASTE